LKVKNAQFAADRWPLRKPLTTSWLSAIAGSLLRKAYGRIALRFGVVDADGHRHSRFSPYFSGHEASGEAIK
jgi:hypothetical protein